MHHPTDRITHTTAFVTPVAEHWLEHEIAQWVHPMKDRSDDPSHNERTLLPRSYISLPCMSQRPEELCQEELWLLLGTPMLDWSMGREARLIWTKGEVTLEC